MNDNVGSRPPIGLTTAISLVIGNMIGAGVFTTSGFSLASIGNRWWVLAAWLLGSLIAMCGAIGYGALARRITQSGGEYLFLSRTIHPMVGFLAGWVSFGAGFTGAIAAAALAFESYAFEGFTQPNWLPGGAVGVAIILGFGGLHSFSMRPGLLTQNVVVGLKLVMLLGFIVFATCVLFFGRWDGFLISDSTNEFRLGGFATSLIYISFCFSGFNAAVYVTSEVEAPKRNVPRALILGTLAVSVLYLLLNGIFLFAPKPEDIAQQQAIAAITARALGGDRLAFLIQIIICLALLSSVSSMIVAGPRVYAKMASDKLFPYWFAAQTSDGSLVNPKAAIWLQAIVAAIYACFVSLVDLLIYLGFTLSLSSAVAVICIFVIRKGSEEEPQRPLVLGASGIYVVATISLAFIAAFSNPWQFAASAGTIASGIIAYFIFAAIHKTDQSPVPAEQD